MCVQVMKQLRSGSSLVGWIPLISERKRINIESLHCPGSFYVFFTATLEGGAFAPISNRVLEKLTHTCPRSDIYRGKKKTKDNAKLFLMVNFQRLRCVECPASLKPRATWL